MANQLFEMYGNKNPLMNQFSSFMSSMQGKDPRQEIQNLLRSGKVSQEQLNEAQSRANQIQGILNPFFNR